MLVGAIHASAPIRKLAQDLWVDKQALLTQVALREKLALLRRVHKLTLLRTLVAVGEVPAPSCLLNDPCRRRLLRGTFLLLGDVSRVYWAKALESLLA